MPPAPPPEGQTVKNAAAAVDGHERDKDFLTEAEVAALLPWLFVSERTQAPTRQSVNYLVTAAATCAGLPPVHPHMLRKSCVFILANKVYDLRLIHDYPAITIPNPSMPSVAPALPAASFDGLWR
jgi:site-specific recombinase XerD